MLASQSSLPIVADAKKEAEAAKEREVALWQEALETGQKVHPLTEETLNKHMQGPIIIEDERNASNNDQVCTCLVLPLCLPLAALGAVLALQPVAFEW